MHYPGCWIFVFLFSVRFANYRGAQLSLRPLFFEVPQQDQDPPFVGRAWLFREIEAHLTTDNPSNRGVVITGSVGTGKTAAALQLVEYSCFGRKRDESIYQGMLSFVFDNNLYVLKYLYQR